MYPAQLSGLDDLSQCAEVAVPPAVVEDRQPAVAGTREFQQGCELVGVACDRLIHDHVTPTGQRLPRMLGVEPARAGDHHHVDVGLEQFVRRAKHQRPRMVGDRRGSPPGIAGDHVGQRHARGAGDERRVEQPSGQAVPDDADPYLGH
jgi:hypothetical protein